MLAHHQLMVLLQRLQLHPHRLQPAAAAAAVLPEWHQHQHLLLAAHLLLSSG
jgi:hypothetical protein